MDVAEEAGAMAGTADPAESVENRRRKMPGFDGRGPDGVGPFTGRGMGYCYDAADRGRAGFRGFGAARGRGFGRGAGYGAGAGGGRGMAYRYGRGGGYYPAPVDYYGAYRYDDVYPRDDEAKMLKDEVSFMENRMKELNSRLADLESAESKKDE